MRKIHDGVGCIIGSHSGQHVCDISVAAHFEQLCLLVVIQFLKHTCLQLGVGVDPFKQKVPFRVGCALDKIGNLGGFEVPGFSQVGGPVLPAGSAAAPSGLNNWVNPRVNS